MVDESKLQQASEERPVALKKRPCQSVQATLSEDWPYFFLGVTGGEEPHLLIIRASCRPQKTLGSALHQITSMSEWSGGKWGSGLHI